MRRITEYIFLASVWSIPIILVLVIVSHVVSHKRASDTCTDLGYVNGSPLRNDCVSMLDSGRYDPAGNPNLIRPANDE
jgi:hypothetical protein